ncbi:hypothetical protein V8C42DRAFT_319740 [Trichoderma barbatum]
MSPAGDEESGIGLQHYPSAVNSTTKSVANEPRHSSVISERRVTRNKEDGTVISQRD